ncbi:5'-methylthioadenosine/adenosylhomocysteine nucleosidase [Ligilactobacillus ceti]|uniref:adenosylhomocysteine nucleosidase n=1 Tax=Ligilactobacillus ceti DSM 22408 TaxID=1122146 RepID=A0A0R2KMX4_9LACO|nr:5'-methylthioadenosine/adenosylhomocysteine nucleosidase [Ligilactobacillus ceti]KRN88950.1 5-methylthioadenosine nucleosidase S-adenosylhomocysteine nucleosidase [Ligilactobacillus ceti DSM 22408]
MKYGILCAMAEELKELSVAMTDVQEIKIADFTFYQGLINNHEVVIVQSGIGKVQAAIVTTLLIANFKIDYMINSGSAGGIGAGLQVGDVVISTGTAYHDADVTAFGYLPGQLPQQPQIFVSDRVLGENIKLAAENTGLNVKLGLIVSGDQFIADEAKIAEIKAIYPEVLCCEMEGAAVGQVAQQFKVPYVVVRAMSDVADGQADQSFDEFIIEAGKRSAQMILNLLK